MGYERTNASTTGLLDARSGEWAHELIERLGMPAQPFGALVEPGFALGRVLAHHEFDAPVFTAASHDTASAYAATPIRDDHCAVLSSGHVVAAGRGAAPAGVQRSLVDQRARDRHDPAAQERHGPVDRAGMRARVGRAVSGAARAALEASPDVPLFDPDDNAFLKPGDMPARVAAACGRSEMSRGDTLRSIFTSLACKCRLVLERLEAASGREITTLHVIGGGARNVLLCRLTADVTGREVLAGPVEATALGNVLVQARAAGELGSLVDMRAVAAASVAPLTYEPSIARDEIDGIYRRFLDVTDLAAVPAA